MKPKELSPVECAKRGYMNTSKDTITCTHCGAYFNTSIYYESNILHMHAEYCKLSTPISLSYSSFSAFTLSSYNLRLGSFNSIEVLPSISFPHDLLDNCELCGIVIECSRKEYALVKSRNFYNVLVEPKSTEKLNLRRGVEIIVGKNVDLISSHRYYCPWVNDVTVEDFSYFTNKPTSQNVGWKIVLDLLLKEN